MLPQKAKVNYADTRRPQSSAPSESSSISSSSWSSFNIKYGTNLRIGIVGGGLGGLALGQLLCTSPNIQVTIYERNTNSIDRLCGFRVMLSAFVLKRLKQNLRPEVWTRVLASIGRQPSGGQSFTFMNSNNEKLFTSDTEEFREQFSTSRWLLRKALLYQTERFLKAGKTYLGFEKLSGGTVKLLFEDGSSDECDLLVGADGVNSKVKAQIRPDAKITTSELAVIYFKVPYTPATQQLLPTQSGTVVLCPHNQNIMVHSWINPEKTWATRYDDMDIAPEESFIMYGVGSPISEFTQKHKPPTEFFSQELKDDIVARLGADPKIDPVFLDLAQQCIVNTAYLHIVKESQAIKKWDTSAVTLIGDAVFNIPTILGKGANCALLDALDLASLLTVPSPQCLTLRPCRLREVAQENVKRRLKERQRNALISNVLYFGDNKVKDLCRLYGMKLAFDWIEDSKAKDFYAVG